MPGSGDPPVLSSAELARGLEEVLAEREPVEIEDRPGRRAAVLLLLYDRAGEAHLLLTKRTDTMVSHPGQVSLPGGVIEPRDPSPAATALRESEEEVGIPAGAPRVLGRLDDVETFASGYVITPFVAHLDPAPTPVPSDAEVALVLEVPVAELLRADSLVPPGAGVATLRYPLADEDVWGATARILRGFSRLARQALAGSPALSAEARGARPAGADRES